MSIVRFAMVCDHCGKRSPEYSGWPTCASCGSDICLTCAVPDSVDADYDHYDALCLKCAPYSNANIFGTNETNGDEEER